jgi:hypothetical protein
MRFVRCCVRLPLVALLLLAPAAAASAQTSKRPIMDFVTPSMAFGDVYWYDQEVSGGPLIFFDYFGRDNAIFGLGLPTWIDGTITETRQRDGRASVHVVMHSSDVITWAYQGPLIFGHTPSQVKLGADAALGDVTLTVDFINKAPGAPLPSFWQLMFVPSVNYQLVRIGLTANADGTLRAAFGVPEGTPGKAHTTQRGLYAVQGILVNGDDVYPAEKVDVHAVQ